MKPKLLIILLIIIALFLCAMLPRDVDDVRTQDATLTSTPAMSGYPPPVTIATAYPIEATATMSWYPPPATAMPTRTWVVPTEPPDRE